MAAEDQLDQQGMRQLDAMYTVIISLENQGVIMILNRKQVRDKLADMLAIANAQQQKDKR